MSCISPPGCCRGRRFTWYCVICCLAVLPDPAWAVRKPLCNKAAPCIINNLAMHISIACIMHIETVIMRTTIGIPENLIAEAMKLTRIKIITEVIK